MNRLQNLAITLDKVGYCLRKQFGAPSSSPSAICAPPPLRVLRDSELSHRVWLGEGSVVHSLFRGMALHQEKSWLRDLYRRVRLRDGRGRSREGLRENLLWLRDELLGFEPTSVCRFDAAADLLHLYAFTDTWFTYRVGHSGGGVLSFRHFSPERLH